MTKAEYLKKILGDWNDVYCDLSVYDFAYQAQYVTDDEELAELARTCLVSTEDFQDYIEEMKNDISQDSRNTV